MIETPRLSRSGIDYIDYQWGFYSGCLNRELNICPVERCWARSFTQRFKKKFPNGFKPTFYPEALMSPLRIKKPAIIGCAFIGDFFGDWMWANHIPDTSGILWDPRLIFESLLKVIESCPQHTFLFLTECPWNYQRLERFPDNVWFGVSVCYEEMIKPAFDALCNIELSHTFISFEPLLGPIDTAAIETASYWKWLDWAIIGAQTQPFRPPQVDQVEELVYTCIDAGVLVFLKENLIPILPKTIPFYVPPKGWSRQKKEIEMVYRQEVPWGGES